MFWHHCDFLKRDDDTKSFSSMKESLVDNTRPPHWKKTKNISKKCWAQQEVVCLEQTQRLCSYFLSSLCVILGCFEFRLYMYVFFSFCVSFLIFVSKKILMSINIFMVKRHISWTLYLPGIISNTTLLYLIPTSCFNQVGAAKDWESCGGYKNILSVYRPVWTILPKNK